MSGSGYYDSIPATKPNNNDGSILINIASMAQSESYVEKYHTMEPVVIKSNSQIDASKPYGSLGDAKATTVMRVESEEK